MPSIAIIGAGPAGLTLARLLLVQAQVQDVKDLQLSIFEHDASATSRFQQGGCLDLHTNTGIAALKAGKMWDDILPHMRYEGEELIIADMNATKLIHVTSDARNEKRERSAQRPEIDREILKQYLLKAVQEIGGEEAITWGKHLASIDPETRILTFRDGAQAGPFDLVVGADGAWSKVRSAITDVKPAYSGISGMEAWIDKEHAGDLWEKFTNFVGKGSFMSYSQGKAATAQRMENGTMKFSIWVKTTDPNFIQDLVQTCGGGEDQIREALLEMLSDWDEQIKMMLRSSWRFRQWPLYELPVGHSWEHKYGLTLIGDAAHLMTPFAGEGVNAAMKDALELSHGIITAIRDGTTLDKAFKKFEQDMFPRNQEVQSKTAHNKTMMFRADAPIGLLSEAGDMIAAEKGLDTSTGWRSRAMIPVRTLWYSYFWSVSKNGALARRRRGT